MQNIVFNEDDSKLNKPDKIRLVLGFSPDFSRLKTIFKFPLKHLKLYRHANMGPP